MVINSLEDNFVIEGTVNLDGTSLIMKVAECGHISTATLPETFDILSKYLPSIFNCQCFNNENNNFKKECQNTEIGHLFEHIMLEHLCIEKIADGGSEATYEGRTSWEEDKTQTFYIEIKVGSSEIDMIKKAFNKSVDLLNKILLPNN